MQSTIGVYFQDSTDLVKVPLGRVSFIEQRVQQARIIYEQYCPKVYRVTCQRLIS